MTVRLISERTAFFPSPGFLMHEEEGWGGIEV